ncbi:MAG: hypothetical protein ACKVQK_11300 [Burkholderiales bacterium]
MSDKTQIENLFSNKFQVDKESIIKKSNALKKLLETPSDVLTLLETIDSRPTFAVSVKFPTISYANPKDPQYSVRQIELHVVEARAVLNAMLGLRERWFQTATEAIDIRIRFTQFKLLDWVRNYEVQFASDATGTEIAVSKLINQGIKIAGEQSEKIKKIHDVLNSNDGSYQGDNLDSYDASPQNVLNETNWRTYNECLGATPFHAIRASTSYQNNLEMDKYQEKVKPTTYLRGRLEFAQWKIGAASSVAATGYLDQQKLANNEKIKLLNWRNLLDQARDAINRYSAYARANELISDDGPLSLIKRIDLHVQEMTQLAGFVSILIPLIKRGMKIVYKVDVEKAEVHDVTDLEKLSIWLNNVEKILRDRRRLEQTTQFVISLKKKDEKFKDKINVNFQFEVTLNDTLEIPWLLRGIGVYFTGSRKIPLGLRIVPKKNPPQDFDGDTDPEKLMAFGATRNVDSISNNYQCAHSDFLWNLSPYRKWVINTSENDLGSIDDILIVLTVTTLDFK